MVYLDLFLFLIGTVILGQSAICYYNVIVYMKTQLYPKNVFIKWIYSISFATVIYLFAGYIFIAIKFTTDVPDYDFLFISSMLLFEAIYILFMVNIQQKLIKTINDMAFDTIQSMIYSIEAKDFYTRGHSEHVYELVNLFYNYLPNDIKSKINLKNLKNAALLHDIGKIGIPENILNKPGILTDDEFNILKHHPKNGKTILAKTSYREICDIVLYHHERVDGNGYYGISDNIIPLESKIIAIADTFSALYTDRIYRKRYSFDKSISIIKESAGTQLDSELVNIFCSIPEETINKKSVSIIFK